MSDIGEYLCFDFWMTLKRKITHPNVTSVPKLVKNELLHQILGLLCRKLKNKNDNLNVGGHLGSGNHLEYFLIIFRFFTGHQSIQHIKNTLYPNFYILSTNTTMGQLFCMILDIWSWLLVVVL